MAKKQPRQRALPGTQDGKIVAIEKAAHDYADIRDERMAWTEREVKAKTKLLDEMKKANKTKYQRGGLTVEIVPEKEKVKVRQRPVENEEEDAA